MAKSVGQSYSRRVFKLCLEGLNHQHSVCKCNGGTSQKNWHLCFCYPHFSRSKDVQIHKAMNSQLSLLRHPLSSTGKTSVMEVSSNYGCWGVFVHELPPSWGTTPHLLEHDGQVFIPAEKHRSACQQVYQKSAMKTLLRQPALSKGAGHGHKALAPLGEGCRGYHCRGTLWPWWEGPRSSTWSSEL